MITRLGVGLMWAGIIYLLSALVFYTGADMLGADGSMVPILLWLLVTPFVAFAGFVWGYERGFALTKL
ncbi:MAG: hypothetical protein AAFR81_08440 [Chloroflexota bacterium]